MLATAASSQPSQAALAHAVEINHQEWIRRQGQIPGVTLHADADMTCVVSREPGRPNAVALARFDDQSASRRIRDVLARAQDCEQLVWWVGPASRPIDLPRRLRAAGFRCIHQLAGMAAELDDAVDISPDEVPGVTIQPLVDFSVFASHPHPFIGPIHDARRRNLVHNHQMLCARYPQRVRALIAMLDGTPVGYALVFIGESNTGIYDVGVLRSHRRRGIGTAITRAAMKFARKHGSSHATLLATHDGKHLYDRLGFSEVCQVGVWAFTSNS